MHQPFYKKLFLIASISFLAIEIFAQPVVPFVARYSTTQKGSLVYISNNYISCTAGTSSGGITCDSARNIPPTSITQRDNNSYPSAYIDIDGDATTFSSSSANLSLPVCSYVTWAGLYWGGDIQQAGVYYARRDSIKLRRPGLASYINLRADTMITANVPAHNRMFFAYKNVTSIVQAGGVGTYMCANLRGWPGANNKTGGWTLVVAYTNDLSNLRNIAVYDGLNIVTNANQTNLTLSGFQTPVSGPITFECGIISYDGDRVVSGVQEDSVLFNDNVGSFIPISNAYNPINDVHNGTISYNGANVASRNPNYLNTMGYDADVFAPNNVLKNYLTNNQTSVTLRESTNGEIIPTHVISFAIDVFEPDLRLIKTATDINGGVTNPGDTIQYSIQALNLGSDTAALVTVMDTLPFNADYVPGSLIVTFGPNGGAKSDAVDGDQGEYVAAGRYIRLRLGNGANAAIGGRISNLAPNNYNTFRFRVVATTDCGKLLCSNIISNQANGVYRGYISGSNQAVLSQPFGTDAFGCPLYGPTNTSITVPPSCATTPADTSVNDCSLPYYFSALAPFRVGYSYYNSSFVLVTTANASGTFYGLKNNGPGCYDTIVVNFTTTAPTITAMVLQYPTCTNNPNGGFMRVNGINGSDSMSYVTGATYTSAPFFRASTLVPTRTFTGLSGGTYTIRVKNATGCFVDTTINLNYINCPPVAADDNYSFNATATYNASVASNDDEPDPDPTTFTLLSGPANGSLVFNSDGSFAFSPGAFRGTTTFTYVICDNRSPSLCDTGLVTITVVSPLPVEMGMFTGELKNNGVLLKWITYSEINNNYFEVQRGVDGVHFLPIGKIAGHGTTNEMYRYQFFDEKPFSGWNYYRLKQVDLDGQTAITNTVKFNLSSLPNDKIEIYPNPNSGTFRLKVNCETEGENKITIVSQYGSVIYETSFYCSGQSIVKEIKLNEVPKGLYYLLVNSKNQTGKYKFTVN